MKNKYKEALNTIKNALIGEYDLDIRILQELIDNYQDYATVKMEYEKELEVYKKALDKACEELEEEGCCGFWNKTKKCNMPYSCKSCWKEYLLKESEKK